jgi:hypothetical protein
VGLEEPVAGVDVLLRAYPAEAGRAARSRSGLFSPRDAPLGDMWDGECGLKQPPLHLECSIVEGATRLDWYYSPRHLGWSGTEIDEWMARYSDELGGLIARS